MVVGATENFMQFLTPSINSHLPVLHCPGPRATATLSQLPPFDIVSRTKLVTRGGNIIRL